MKTRIVVMSLISVVAFIIIGCNSDTGSEDQSRQVNETPPPANAQTTKTELAKELKQAAALLDEAISDFERRAEDAARRTLGDPTFLINDFREPRAFAAKLNGPTRGALSKYLLSKFEPATKTLMAKPQEDVPSPTLAMTLKAELDKQLQNRELFDPSRFPSDLLRAETLAELEQKRTRISKLPPEELAHLNRLLLQDSYREFIEPARAETVLSHLQKAETLAQKLNASELPPDFQLNLNETEKVTRALLRQQSEDGEETVLSVASLTTVRGDLNAVRVSLEPTTGSTPGIFDWILGLLWEGLYYLLLIAAVLIPIALIVFLIKRARDNAAAKELANLQALKKVIDRYDQLRQEFGSSKNQNTSEIEALKDQLSRLENAYRILVRQNSQYANSSVNSQNVNRFYEPPPAQIREEPEFPVSAETYLQRMKGLNRPSTVIRPDFQNGILVKDAEGRGELVLVEDSAGPVDFRRLFVVPSVSQFQMKQDFYNYYDGYYECDQPTAGDVWIVHPAVVEKVNGGWRLMEKGRLEVR